MTDDISAPTSKKYCPGCKQSLATTCFGNSSSSKDGLRRTCKSCRHEEYLEHSKENYQRQREAFFAKSPEEQEDIRTRQNKQCRELAAKKRQTGLCSACLARPVLPGIRTCESCYTKKKHYRVTLRDEVFTAYGSTCASCGESHPSFLSVDHMENDGAEHRRITGNGFHLYLWLRKNGFPQEGFQLLCSNCNWLKHVSREVGNDTYHKLWYANVRQETLTAYGGKCACCGESNTNVLTIDHMENDGAEHRRMIGAGCAFYMWLRKNGFPQERFQALCFNCNRAKYFYGVCPHRQ